MPVASPHFLNIHDQIDVMWPYTACWFLLELWHCYLLISAIDGQGHSRLSLHVWLTTKLLQEAQLMLTNPHNTFPSEMGTDMWLW